MSEYRSRCEHGLPDSQCKPCLATYDEPAAPSPEEEAPLNRVMLGCGSSDAVAGAGCVGHLLPGSADYQVACRPCVASALRSAEQRATEAAAAYLEAEAAKCEHHEWEGPIPFCENFGCGSLRGIAAAIRKRGAR